jgi:hypothetical protein
MRESACRARENRDCDIYQLLSFGGTSDVHQLIGRSKDLRIGADGDGVVSMVGLAALRMLADRTGPTRAIYTILTRPGFRPVHDRGRVLTEMACLIAAGGTHIVYIEALRAQAEVFGPRNGSNCGSASQMRRSATSRSAASKFQAPLSGPRVT